MLAVLSQIIVLIILLFVFQFLVVQFYDLAFRGFAPFIATRRRVVARIVDQIKVAPEARIYELGAGQAGFLRALRKKYPKAKLIAVEFSLIPWLIGGIVNALSGSKIEFRKENIFKTDLTSADLAYCYLNISTMNRLEEKFGKELKPGAQVVSYEFHLPNKKEEKMIDLGSDGKIWIYRY